MAEAGTQFTQSLPRAGAPPTERTTVRVLYDDAAIYVGVRMLDAHPDSIVAQLSRRDAASYSDWVNVIVDTYHDKRTGFRFAVNPRGVQRDIYVFNDRSEDPNWDAVWDVATSIDSSGWNAEFRIPLTQLRYASAPPSDGRVWGFQVMREIARRAERDVFAPWSQSDAGFVSMFADLTGLVGLPSSARREIQPYISSTLTRDPGNEADPFRQPTAFKQAIGLDARFGLPKGLTLTATANPDFGQVEVDPAVVNLTAFETFFPEKRPFFLEASDVFGFGQVRTNNDFGSQTFLYSRRIGRVPQLRPKNVAWSDVPDQTTILGAVKLTGKHDGWTVGALEAVTSAENARTETTDGVRGSVPVEPRTNYLAGRVRRDLRGGKTVVGGIVTSVVRELSTPAFNSALTSSAGLAGLDFEHAWDGRRYTLSGFAAASRVDGAPLAIQSLERNSTHQYQRPDAPYLALDSTRKNLTGTIAELALARSGPVYGSVAVKSVSPGFEMNDLGFHGRTDYRSLAALIGYQSYAPKRTLQRWSAHVRNTDAWNFGGNAIASEWRAAGSAVFQNQWSVGASAGYLPVTYSDRLTRGGPLARTPGSWNVGINGGSDGRATVTTNASARFSRDQKGATSFDGAFAVDLRAGSAVYLSVSPSVNARNGGNQFVGSVADSLATATFGRRYVFGQLRQTTLSVDTRIEWTLTPRLSMQTYVQPFMSSGSYGAYGELAAPGRSDLTVYGRDAGSITRTSGTTAHVADPDGPGPAPAISLGNPNFTHRSLRGNAVLRWEYKQGSTLYLVWQQNRQLNNDGGDFDLRRDLGAAFRGRAANVFLLKASYWFSW